MKFILAFAGIYYVALLLSYAPAWVSLSFFGYVALTGLVLAFMAGAKKASYTPTEIDAEYDEQYRQLNGGE